MYSTIIWRSKDKEQSQHVSGAHFSSPASWKFSPVHLAKGQRDAESLFRKEETELILKVIKNK
jgi:hypothetical protein